MIKKQEKLQWKVKHESNFKDEIDFLETILLDSGVKEEDIKGFLNPTSKYVNDPKLMPNMEKACEIVRKNIKAGNKIFVRVDADQDGFSSSCALIQFLRELNPEIQIDYKLNYEKAHGLTYKDIMNHSSDEYGVIIVPDASMTVKDARMITSNFSADIIVLDHHIPEEEYFDKVSKKWIPRQEAVKIYKEDKTRIEHDNYRNYCISVNCMDEEYPNHDLAGAGVVQKFIECYYEKYGEEDLIDEKVTTKYLDLVSLGCVADSMDVTSLETRYYILEGLKERNYNNKFITAIVDRNEDEFKFGRTIVNSGWNIAPKVNGVIRYGKPQEQEDMFSAFLGEERIIPYQPKRKSKYDPKPEVEYHTLQETMARVADNVKSRQDSEVRKFMKELEEQIETQKLDENSVLFVDGSKVLEKGTVSGLVAGKLASKYFRPVVLMRERDSSTWGGSMRGYDKGIITDTKSFLESIGVTCMGHANASGILLKKEDLQSVIKKCNEVLPVESLCTVHTVDWEIPASQLKKDYVIEVAQNYKVFGNNVPEPTFAITGLCINAANIKAYGENNSFIRFVYNGIPFIKKYCSKTDYDEMVKNDRFIIGSNKKNLKLNLICQFVLNKWEDEVTPQVKILYFDSESLGNSKAPAEDFGNEVKTKKNDTKSKKSALNDFDEFDEFDEFNEKPKTKKTFDDLDFDW